MTKFTSKERALVGKALLKYAPHIGPAKQIAALKCLAMDYENEVVAVGITDEASDLCNDLAEIQSLIEHIERSMK